MKKISRKKFLQKAAIAAAAVPAVISSCSNESNTSSADAPAILSKKNFKWIMVTTWPPKFPVLGEGCELFADWVREMSGGRLSIKVFGGGELIPALEVFDAVSTGTAHMGHGCAYYWAGKTAAAQFFASVPFGFNAQQMNIWLNHAGAMALSEELYESFDMIPLAARKSGMQMGGWFNKEINTTADLKGLKMRIPGLGGKVLEKAGGTAVLSAGSEIYTNLERGVIDATEWLGPYHDYKMGFHKIAKYYYSPGWHECGTTLEMVINKEKFNTLPKDLQAIVRTAAARLNSWMFHEMEAKNAEFLSKIKSEASIEMRTYPPEVLAQLRQYTEEALADITAKDPMCKKVYASFSKFKNQIKDWSRFTEKEFYNNIQA